MKAYLIDPDFERVDEIDLDAHDDFESIYHHIGCDIVEPIVLTNGDTMWVDEEACYKQDLATFSIHTMNARGRIKIMGKAVVTAQSGDGDLLPPNANLEKLRGAVRWD